MKRWLFVPVLWIIWIGMVASDIYAVKHGIMSPWEAAITETAYIIFGAIYMVWIVDRPQGQK